MIRICLVGRNVARRLHLALGNSLELHYLDRSASCSVAGIVDAGGTEDNQIFASLRAVQSLANLPEQIGVAQLSVTGTTQVIADYAARLTSALPQYQVRPIRQVAEAEGALLGRIRLLIVSMVLLILMSHGAVRARDHGGAGDGTAQTGWPDEIARWLNLRALWEYFSPRWACWAPRADCSGAILGSAFRIGWACACLARRSRRAGKFFR